jgi:hypothetical protein
VLKPIVELYHLKYENVNLKKKKSFVDVDGPSYVCKMVEIHHKRKDQLHH